MDYAQDIDLDIHSAAVLEEVAGLLHDCYFSTTGIRSCVPEGWFKMVLWRPTTLFRRTRIWHGLLHHIDYAQVPCELGFNQVEEVTVPTMELETIMLVDLRYESAKQRISIRTMPDQTITLRVGGLSGWLKDVGEPTWDGPSMDDLGGYGIGP